MHVIDRATEPARERDGGARAGDVASEAGDDREAAPPSSRAACAVAAASSAGLPSMRISPIALPAEPRRLSSLVPG